MTVRMILFGWLFAFAVAAGLFVAPVFDDRPASPVFHHAAVAVIGSSLTASAIPSSEGDKRGLLGDGQSYWRVARPLISEDETRDLISRATNEKAKIILVEANALLFDFAKMSAERRCDQPGARIRKWLKAAQIDAITRYAVLLGKRDPQDLDDRKASIAYAWKSIPISKRGVYPISIRGPCDPGALRALVGRAHSQGTVIALILPPTSQSAERALGARQRRELNGRAESLAKDLHVPLFSPPVPWPDDEFIDQAHLNQRGREHALELLRAWWRRRQ